LSEELTLLIIDTNILLHHFEALQQFIADVEALSLPVKIVVPGIVICELDGFVKFLILQRGRLVTTLQAKESWRVGVVCSSRLAMVASSHQGATVRQRAG